MMQAKKTLADQYKDKYDVVVEALRAIGVRKPSGDFPHRDKGYARLIVVAPGMSFLEIMENWGKQIFADGCYVVDFDKLLGVINDEGDIWDGVESDDDATLSNEGALNIVKRVARRMRSLERIDSVRFSLRKVDLSPQWKAVVEKLRRHLVLIEAFSGNENGTTVRNDDVGKKRIVMTPVNACDFVKMLEIECRFTENGQGFQAEKFETLKSHDEPL